MTGYLSSSHTALDVINHVKRQFGDEAAVQITDEDIIRWINAGQDEIFRRAEPIKTTANTNLVAGQSDYVFPSDVLRIQAIYLDGVIVEQRSTQDFEEYVLKNEGANVTGTPFMWHSWGGNFSFYPIPDADSANGIQLRYIQTPTVVAAAGDALSVPDAFYNRLVEYVLQQAYELDENFTASDMKAAQFSTNLEASMGRDQVKPNTYPVITIREEDL